jgi:hypothetical protein
VASRCFLEYARFRFPVARRAEVAAYGEKATFTRSNEAASRFSQRIALTPNRCPVGRLAPPVAVRLGDIRNFGQRPGNRSVTGRD